MNVFIIPYPGDELLNRSKRCCAPAPDRAWAKDPIYWQARRENAGNMKSRSGNGRHAQYHRVVQDLRTVLRDGGQLLRRRAEGARERAKVAAVRTDRAMREHPYQAVALVFAAGLFAGIVAASLFTASRKPKSQPET